MPVSKTIKHIDLAEAFLSLRNTDEVLRFLEDIMTPEERAEISARWQAAKLLTEGESYRKVAAATKLSTTTVTRVARWLKSGAGGYKIALSRIK